jgi:predicted  nucleic acid-binding Zn-ribbon protein
MASWLRKKNWLHETKIQELERRVKALEASVQSAHDRINELDERLGRHAASARHAHDYRF